MNRFLCLHLHFYQPPRENAWLGEIERQPSAYPFHDWNERINSECYRANANSRILDAEGLVVALTNNYAKVSFNFGPTLMSWMEDKDPATYQQILDGDRESQRRFGGHGSAIAQCYNHMIMPLANRCDQETQVRWGLRDFEKRFGREAESIWLPETAVDTATLEILAEHGMKYVILAPRQARAVRDHADEAWRDVSRERVDPREPYWIPLPSGRRIAVFFYDGPMSKAVAFEGLLHDGDRFADRLIGGFDPSPASAQLVHIATDGETYGHHHRDGDMALAYALARIESESQARITNYGEYLELHPPRREAQIFENSSWSCEHGVERWRADCGCNSGMKPGWHQRWREPLRRAFDRLRDDAGSLFVEGVKNELAEPWAARDDYIEVVNDRSLANIDAFLRRWCGGGLRDVDARKVLKALEAQRQLMLMYTSCAWFFDEVSGIETVQNMQYAYRAAELISRAFGVDLLPQFLRDLEEAASNIPDIADGRRTFESYVRPSRIDNARVASHFAVASVFEDFGPQNEVYGHKITLVDFIRRIAGPARLALGRARIRSRTTLDRNQFIFGVIHFGQQSISAGVKPYDSAEEFHALAEQAQAAFERADFPQTLRVLDRYFGEHTYSLKDLFHDEQRRFADLLLDEALLETEERLARLYHNHFPLMVSLMEAGVAVPRIFNDIAQFVQNRGLRHEVTSDRPVSAASFESRLREARRFGAEIDGAGLSRRLEIALERVMDQLETADEDVLEVLKKLDGLLKLGPAIPGDVHWGPVQNRYFRWMTSRAPKIPGLAEDLARILKLRPLPAATHREPTKDKDGPTGDSPTGDLPTATAT